MRHGSTNFVEAFWVQPGTCWNLVWTLTTLPRRKIVYVVCNPGLYSLIQKYIVNIPGSSKYAKFLPFGRIFFVKRHNYYIIHTVRILVTSQHFGCWETRTICFPAEHEHILWNGTISGYLKRNIYLPTINFRGICEFQEVHLQSCGIFYSGAKLGIWNEPWKHSE